KINILPTRNFSIKVDKEAVLKNKIVAEEDSALITETIRFSIGEENTLDKSELGILNIIAGIAKAGWNRPVYFSAGFAGGNSYLGLDEYIQLEGLAHKLVPVRTIGSKPSPSSVQRTDLDKSLDLFLNKFQWGGIE